MTPKPTILLKPGEELRIDDAAAENRLDPALLLADIRNVLNEHYRSFGVRAFNCEYNPRSGHIISANSNIGWLSGQLVELQIQPKIPGIDIGKCLGLAQAIKNSPASFCHSSKISAIISKDVQYFTAEYIAFSFLDSVYTVIQNGLARKFEDVIQSSRDRAGQILIQEWAALGLIPPPVKSSIEPTIDILPNQILSAAIKECIALCKAAKLHISLRHCQEQLQAARAESVTAIDLDSVFLHKFNLPRQDYSRALAFALAILRGCSIHSGHADFLPSLTVDLDQLFEDYSTATLANLLNPAKFEVRSQPELEHSADPPHSGIIKPDVLIINRTTRRPIVLDLKNKYTGRATTSTFHASNPDLFQLSYYMRTAQCTDGVLVYPACAPPLAFPVRGSESAPAYAAKVTAFAKKAVICRRSFFHTSASPQCIHAYYIDLGGSMSNTLRSVASLALYIEYLTNPI